MIQISSRNHCWALLSTTLLCFFLFILLTLSTLAAGHQHSVEVHLERSSIIHVWMRARKAQKLAHLSIQPLVNGNLQHQQRIVFSTEETEFFVFKKLAFNELGAHVKGKYTLSWNFYVAEVSYLYVYESENVKKLGIRPAHVRPEAMHAAALHKHSFHLRAPVGWNNEPNGITRTSDSLYHVFYQHIPNQNQPILLHVLKETVEAMHWGHAVSTDLANWVHQPVFLLPKYKKLANTKNKYEWVEQWFSGSARAYGKKGGLRVFVTNFQANREPSLAVQEELLSDDGVELSEERLLIDHVPEHPSFNGKNLKLKIFNFRDPNVFQGPGGFFYMTLGTEDTTGEGGAILLYRTKEPADLESGWEYVSVLLTDNRSDMGNIECPGLFPLGKWEDKATLYVLVYAREWGHTDSEPHRARDMLMCLGHFDGHSFKKISEQTLDFAYGSYGHQGIFEPVSGQALMMGWLSIWNDWDQTSDFYSSQTLPRVVKAAPKGDGLLISPHPLILQKLKGNSMHGESNKEVNGNGKEEVENNILVTKYIMSAASPTAYILLEIDQQKVAEGKQLFVQIEHPMYAELGVRVSVEGLELIKRLKVAEGGQKGLEDRRRMAAGARPDFLHIFIDVDSLEVFGELERDGGTPRWFGAARLTGNGAAFVSGFEVQRHRGLVSKQEAWHMKPARIVGTIYQNLDESASYSKGIAKKNKPEDGEELLADEKKGIENVKVNSFSAVEN